MNFSFTEVIGIQSIKKILLIESFNCFHCPVDFTRKELANCDKTMKKKEISLSKRVSLRDDNNRVSKELKQ